MSLSHWNSYFLVNLITLNSTMKMNVMDSQTVDDEDDDDHLSKSPTQVTFTLGSPLSSSKSSLHSYQDVYRKQSLPELNSDDRRPLNHSQSMPIDYQRRRPLIEDPYQVAPNLQILNDWMIVSRLIYAILNSGDSLMMKNRRNY